MSTSPTAILRVQSANECRMARGYWGFSSQRLDQIVEQALAQLDDEQEQQQEQESSSSSSEQSSTNLPQEWRDYQYARDVLKHQKKKSDANNTDANQNDDENANSNHSNDSKPTLRYHITLALGKEIKSLTQEQQDQLLEPSNNMLGHPVFLAGLALTPTCAYGVVALPRAAQLRRQAGLPPKHLHVTVGFPAAGDDHTMAKGLETVTVPLRHPLAALQNEWLPLVRAELQRHRNVQQKRQPDNETMDLTDLSDLCRAICYNINATYPNEHFLIEQWALLWCRVAGLAQDYDTVTQAADTILHVRPQCAPALGYKGYALFQRQQYTAALVCLDEANTIFQTTPVKDHGINNQQRQRQAHQVEDCLVRCCQALGRELPVPPLAKFPRTAHCFRPQDSQAVTEDDQVLPKDSALMQLMTQTPVLLQEKIDGSNLGFSLGYNGHDILIQNRSHYLCQGEHPQYNPINAWIETHREALLQVLQSEEKRSSRNGLILFGEWMVARHSIPYHKLPGYFVAFDLYDIAEQKFYSQPRLHAALQGTGIPVVPTVGEYQFETSGATDGIEAQLLPFLETPSKFRNDGGTLEGIVFRIDSGDWNVHRGKLVRPDFVAGIDQHWATRTVAKQTVDFEYAEEYLQECYDLAPTELPAYVEQTRSRFAVVYDKNTNKPPAIVPFSDDMHLNNPLAVKMPRNLSWLWPGEVAVSSTPKKPEQIKAFYDAMNIKLVITLTEEQPLWDGMFEPLEGECQNTFSPVPNYCPPTLVQMDEIGDAIVRRIANGDAVLEHCGGGKGRAGTVAACLLLRFGVDGIRSRIENEGGTLFARAPFMTSDEAIKEIRRVRPESIETEIQEDFVREYSEHLWRKYTEQDELLGDVTVDEFEASTAPVKGAPKYVMLMGLPGCGKSTIGRALSLVGRTPTTKFVHAEQDEMGHKSCVNFVGRMAAKVSRGEKSGICVDCTNTTTKHRSEWLSVMHEPPKDETALIFVKAEEEKCIARVMARATHQTILFGRGDTIIKGFAKSLQPPTDEEEKRFGLVKTVESQEDVEKLLSLWGLAIKATT